MSKTVFINSLGYLASPYIKDATLPLEISEAEYSKTRTFGNAEAWKWNFETKTFELVQTPSINALRFERQLECFSIINRGYSWYRTLTEKQLAELDEWYQKWLDVTETSEIPKMPEWLH